MNKETITKRKLKVWCARCVDAYLLSELEYLDDDRGQPGWKCPCGLVLLWFTEVKQE